MCGDGCSPLTFWDADLAFLAHIVPPRALSCASQLAPLAVSAKAISLPALCIFPLLLLQPSEQPCGLFAFPTPDGLYPRFVLSAAVFHLQKLSKAPAIPV